MSDKEISVNSVCSSCGGTGLYRGFCEKEGYPVVCTSCDGSGCETITYMPFVKRKLLRGIKGVSLSRGRFILTGVGSTGDIVSYADFLKGKLKYNRD